MIFKATGNSVDVMFLAGFLSRWMRDQYTPFLLSKKGKVLVFAATASLLAAGIYGVTKVRLSARVPWRKYAGRQTYIAQAFFFFSLDTYNT